MRTLIEASAFLALALAAHLAFWMPRQVDGLEGSGSEGQSLLSINASSASVAQMVKTWDTPPDTADTVEVALLDPAAAPISPDMPPPMMEPVDRMQQPTLAPPTNAAPPDLPQVQKRAPDKMQDAPQMAMSAIAAPQPPSPQAQPQQTARMQQAPVMALPSTLAAPAAPTLPSHAPPPPRQQHSQPDAPTPPTISKRPPPTVPAKAVRKTAKPAAAKTPKTVKKKVKVARKPSKPSVGANARVAQGTGGGVAKGNKKKSKTATVSKSQKRSLLAKWGGQIRARIARRAPRGLGRGTAVVTITVSGSGSLLGVRLSKSSGNPKIDRLALAAVKKAGRFPAAPRKLGVRKHTFRLPIKSK